MPFFLNTYHKQLYKRNQIKNATLQVRTSPNQKLYSRKRVWLNASLTVEAALGLSLFVFAAVTLMIPMKMMDNQRQIQAALEAVCEDASKYAYVQYRIQNGGGDSLNQQDMDTEQVWQSVDAAAVCLYASAKIGKYADKDMVSNISFLRSEVFQEEDIIHLVMDYKMNFPFPVFRLTGLPMTAVSRRRAWTGRDGRLGDESLDGETDDDVMVYVGKNSTRYHWSRTCHYLDNQLTSYTKNQMATIRNEYGRKYGPCAVCGALGGDNGAVYVMPSGSSYHSNPYCSSIVAYVKMVPLSEVSYLGACSYCSR